MKLKLEINGKTLLAALALSGSVVFANYVSIVDAKSAGGIIVEEDPVLVGTVSMWAGSSAPDGWLEMKGQSTAGYPELAKIVGSNIPDMRGKFARGWDNGAGVDSGRSINSIQQESLNASDLTFKGNAVPGHTHTRGSMEITGETAIGEYDSNRQVGAFYGRTSYSNSGNGTSAGGSTDFYTKFKASRSWTGATSSAGAHTPSGTIQGGSETRPVNVALMYIIKAE